MTTAHRHLPPTTASQAVSRSSAKWRLRSVCARHRAGGGARRGPPVTKEETPPAGQRARPRPASRGAAVHAHTRPLLSRRALGGAPPRERARCPSGPFPRLGMRGSYRRSTDNYDFSPPVPSRPGRGCSRSLCTSVLRPNPPHAPWGRVFNHPAVGGSLLGQTVI